MNWKGTLTELIDKELVLADSVEIKLTVNPGDVRQEMEDLFGPNIITNLDKIGMTYDEAYKMVLEDISIKRTLYFRAQANAISQVTPQKIKAYYEDYAKNNIRDNKWIFNVVTIRHRDSTKGAEAANLIHHLLAERKVALTDLDAELDKGGVKNDKQLNVSISEEFTTQEKELSDVYRKILAELQNDSISAPIAQKSRNDNSTLFRIFYLKSMIPGGTIPFSELEGPIKDRLIGEAMAKESESYFKRMRQHFDVQDNQMKEVLSSDFQPFVLK